LATEQRAVERAIGLFKKDRVFANIKRKPLAPGGPRIGKEEIYMSSLSHFEFTPSPAYAQNRLRYEKKLKRMLKFLDLSRAENGKFFYRFHNAIYVLRAPASLRELFSVARAKYSPYYNPRTLQFFLSHRF